jgi:hypothetical protein
MCLKAESQITVVVDSSTPSGVLSKSIPQSDADDLASLLLEVKEQFPFEILISEPSSKDIAIRTRLHLGKSYKETHCSSREPPVEDQPVYSNDQTTNWTRELNLWYWNALFVNEDLL